MEICVEVDGGDRLLSIGNLFNCYFVVELYVKLGGIYKSSKDSVNVLWSVFDSLLFELFKSDSFKCKNVIFIEFLKWLFLFEEFLNLFKDYGFF